MSASFEEFCVAHHERLVRALALHCGDWDLAEELAEDTMVRAYEKWHEVQKVQRPSAWLYRVGANLAASYFRRKQAERRALARVASEDGDRHDGWMPDAGEALELQRAVASLPTQQRKAVVLRYFLDLSSVDAARELDVTEGYMRVLTHRALTSLRDRYGVGVGEGADHD